MKNNASNYYKQGYSCSESVVQAAIDAGLCDKSLLAIASSFSGGMSSGCLCGAVAGAQLVLGCNFGKENSKNNPEIARAKAKEFIDEFKKNHKATCCKVLTAGLAVGSPERKHNCTSLVEECAVILEDLVKVKTTSC
jgi:C_GCAxxG_C_C family probable redox protein